MLASPLCLRSSELHRNIRAVKAPGNLVEGFRYVRSRPDRGDPLDPANGSESVHNAQPL